MPRCSRGRHPAVTRSSATAAKSSYARRRFCFTAAWCHLGSELAATADIRDDEYSAALEPCRAHQWVVGRCERHLEPAVPVQQGRSLTVRHGRGRDTSKGIFVPSFGGRLVLADGESLRIEEDRGLFEPLWDTGAGRTQRQGDRRDEVLDSDEIIVGLVRVYCGDIRAAKLRQTGEFMSRPSGGCAGQRLTRLFTLSSSFTMIWLRVGENDARAVRSDGAKRRRTGAGPPERLQGYTPAAHPPDSPSPPTATGCEA